MTDQRPDGAGSARLRIATYNVHGCVVRGGEFDPSRTAAVLRELDADVIGLQEVYASENDETRDGERSETASTLKVLAEAVRLEPVFGATLARKGLAYGNALLTSRPVLDVRRHDLSVPGREPRGALETTLDVFGRRVSVFVTHLGLRSRERWHQCQRLAALFDERSRDVLTLVGDMNEWNRFSRSMRLIGGRLGGSPAPRSFPSVRPTLALDRIWVGPSAILRALSVHDTPLARRTSDHLPVRAVLDCNAAEV